MLSESVEENEERAMTERERNEADAKWYADRYLVASVPLAGCDRPMKLADHKKGETRRCRFCGRATPEVTFKKEAHAVPEALGNRCLISMNECDDCNDFFAKQCDDHLGKATGPMRTISQVHGKRGVPTHKAKDGGLRVEVGEGVSIEVRDRSTITDDGNSSLKLFMKTQPYIPLTAAKGLVKVACSLARPEQLPALARTIAWVRSPTTPGAAPGIQSFPVLVGFVPGPAPYGDGQVTLLLRKADADRKLPFMWVVVGFGNVQLQTFVPFTSEDDWSSGQMSFECRFFPLIPSNEDLQFGPCLRGKQDWSGTAAVETSVDIGMHYDLRIEQNPAAGESK